MVRSSKAPSAKPPRTRLDPDARKALILDAAAAIVTNEGVSAVNMERLGRDAGISKALVYFYFPNRNDLLQALLLREVGLNQKAQWRVAEAARDVEALIRVTTRTYLQHVAKRGVLIQRLLHEPSIAEAMHQIDERGRRSMVSYLQKRLLEEYPMPQDVAATLIELNLGLTGAGGAYLDRNKRDLQMVEDILVEMIIANVHAVASRYARSASQRSARRVIKARPKAARRLSSGGTS